MSTEPHPEPYRPSGALRDLANRIADVGDDATLSEHLEWADRLRRIADVLHPESRDRAADAVVEVGTTAGLLARVDAVELAPDEAALRFGNREVIELRSTTRTPDGKIATTSQPFARRAAPDVIEPVLNMLGHALRTALDEEAPHE